MSRYYSYNVQNWDNCPCDGQLEISAAATSSKETMFKIVGGIFFKEKADDKKSEGLNDEL